MMFENLMPHNHHKVFLHVWLVFLARYYLLRQRELLEALASSFPQSHLQSLFHFHIQLLYWVFDC